MSLSSFSGGGSLAQNLINAVNHVPSFTGGFRLPGNSQFTTGSSGIHTSFLKFEAEAPFNAVRVWVGEKNTSGVAGTWVAAVAPTETMALDTINNSYVPIVGGTAFNSLASANNGPGYRPVTWDNGASSKVATLTTGSNSATYMVSDWMPAKSVARADVVGGRPAILLRVCQNNAVGVYTQLNGNFSAYNAARGLGLPWFRDVVSSSTTNDAVTTLTNLPAAIPGNGGFFKYAWLEFSYDVPCRSVVTIGDSTHEGTADQYGYNPWPLVGLLPLSTQSAPIGYINLAGSGHSATQYLALLDNILNAGFLPTDIIFQGWSQNGFTQNTYGADNLIAQTTNYMRKLRALGVRVWMDTAYSTNGYSGVAETARLKVINWVRSIAASGLVTLIDTDPLITDYSVAGSSSVLSAFDSGDHVHANSAGQTLMSNLLNSTWTAKA